MAATDRFAPRAAGPPASSVLRTASGLRTTPPGDRGRNDRATRVVAVAALVAVGLDLRIVEGITTATLVALFLTPVWWRAARGFIGARALFLLAGAALVSGQWLAELAQADHAVSAVDRRASALLLLGAFCIVGLIIWARTVLPLRSVGLAYGAGLVLQLGVIPPNPVNPWKHGISFTLAVLLLAAAADGRARRLELPALLGLAAASALFDSRSAFATFLLSAVLVAWQRRPVHMSRRASAMSTIATLGLVAACVYMVGTSLIVDGYLGRATQQRSIEQIESSGSLLLGGRPEWGATIALVQHRPWGFGTGVEANLEEILVAKSGMAAIQYDPNNGYVERYMFGGAVKLHALVADLWAGFGLPGLVLALALIGLVVWSVATAIARRTASALVIYLTCLTAWNFAFGPIYSSLPSLALTLGIVLVARPSAADAVPGATRPLIGAAE